MSINNQTPAEQTRSRLRLNLAALTKDVASLPAGSQTAFAELVKDLDLGPEPEMTECPKCHHLGIKGQTICGFCWTKTAPH